MDDSNSYLYNQQKDDPHYSSVGRWIWIYHIGASYLPTLSLGQNWRQSSRRKSFMGTKNVWAKKIVQKIKEMK